MGFKTLSFFCPVLGGPPQAGEAGSAPLRRADRRGVSCRRRSGSSVSPVGSPLESGVSPAHIGPSNAAACHRAAPETTPLWRLFLIKRARALSLSHTHRSVGTLLVFGGFAFLPVSLGPAGDCPCKDSLWPLPFGRGLGRVCFQVPPCLVSPGGLWSLEGVLSSRSH